MVQAMRTAGIVAAIALSSICLLGLQRQARADTARAWTAAKAGLPADTKIVIGVDVTAIQKTQLFQTLYPKVHDKPDVAEMLDTMKDTCKLDPLSVVRGVVIGMSTDRDDGAVYIALSGVDRAKLSSCFQRVAQARHKDTKVAVKQDGDITELVKGSDSAFIAWVGKDVIAVSLHAQDKASLGKWTGGKGAFAKSELARTLGKVNATAAIWAAGESAKEIEAGITVKGGYGAVTVGNGNVAADVHAMMETAAQATSAASMANKQLDAARQGGQGVPPELAALLKAVMISADKDEVRIKANILEKDLLAIVAVFDKSGSP
jgi:hypothetical protein